MPNEGVEVNNVKILILLYNYNNKKTVVEETADRFFHNIIMSTLY
jgi:hypothetical protein